MIWKYLKQSIFGKSEHQRDKKKLFYFETKTYVVGIQKNRLNDMH